MTDINSKTTFYTVSGNTIVAKVPEAMPAVIEDGIVKAEPMKDLKLNWMELEDYAMRIARDAYSPEQYRDKVHLMLDIAREMAFIQRNI